jgi:hypothetical protein
MTKRHGYGKYFTTVIYFIYLSIASYLLTEVALYLALRNGWYVPNLDGLYFDKPPAIFDEVRGYKWLDNAARDARIANGQVVFGPTLYQVDSRGYIGRPAFSDRGPRFAVLGDSFTDLPFIERNWLDQAAATWRAEFVSFALTGGGIVNWHSIFFNEVLKDRRGFDGLIIAAYNDDFYRRFVATTSDRIFWYGNYYDSPEAAKRNQDSMSECPFAFVVPRLQMRWFIALAEKKYLFGLNTAFLAYHYGTNLLMQRRRAKGGCIHSVIMKPQFDLLSEIVKAAAKRGMAITIATVPDRGLLVNYIRNGTLSPQASDMGRFAKNHGISLFDGYAAFAAAMPKGTDPTAFVDSMWLQFDGHWNQRGSDLFGTAIADYLAQHGPAPHNGN